MPVGKWVISIRLHFCGRRSLLCLLYFKYFSQHTDIPRFYLGHIMSSKIGQPSLEFYCCNFYRCQALKTYQGSKYNNTQPHRQKLLLRWLNKVIEDHEARASDINRKLIFSLFLLFFKSKLLKYNKQGPKFAVQ